MGNAALKRAFGIRDRTESPAVQRVIVGPDGRKAFESTVFQGDAKLESVLNNEGRLSTGDSGDSVVRVQEALIRAGFPLPQHGADGKYGEETASAVRQFKASDPKLAHAKNFGDVGPGTMEKLDTLNKSGGGGLVVPPVPPKPQLNENVLDEGLENRLDQVAVEYGNILQVSNDALVLLERDLQTTEVKGLPPILNLLKFAAEKVFSSVFSPLEDAGKVFSIVKDAFEVSVLQDDAKVVKTLTFGGVDIPFKKIEKAAKEHITAGLLPSTSLEGGSLEAFIDMQRKALFHAIFAAQKDLFDVTKPTFRKVQPGDQQRFEETSLDPRLDRAFNLHIAVQKGTAAANHNQYFEALKQWTAYQAQHELDPNENSHKNGTDLTRLGTDDPSHTKIRGILEVVLPDINDKNAREPIKINSLHISGLSEKVRQRINEDNKSKTIGELGFPRRVSDSKGGFLNPNARNIKLARNERGGDPVDLGNDPKGNKWLRQRTDDDTVLSGMIQVMDQVDKTPISAVEGGIQGPT
jgi:hypothetical protein